MPLKPSKRIFWKCAGVVFRWQRIWIASSDARLGQLRDAIKVLLSDAPNRAEQVQMIFSDKTPPPARDMKSQI